MALNAACHNGHIYIQADVYKDWPKGAPYCPECFKEWLGDKKMPCKGKKKGKKGK